MKVIIPCAGYATRLHPLTLNKPKHLLHVQGEHIIDHVMNKLTELHIVSEVVIVTNEKFYEAFTNWKENNKTNWDIPIKVLNNGTTTNEERLGQIGDIHFALEKENIDDNLLVIAGDNLFNFSLKPSFDLFKEKDEVVNPIHNIASLNKAKEFGVVQMGENGIIHNFEEKPENPATTHISTGIYFIPEEKIKLYRNYIEAGNNPDKMGYFLKWLVDNNTAVYGFPHEEKWFDIGVPEALEEAEKHFRNE